MSATLLHAVALACYIFAGIFYGASLTLKTPKHTERARIFFLIAFAVHTVAIGAHCMLTRQSPFASASGTLSTCNPFFEAATGYESTYRDGMVSAATCPSERTRAIATRDFRKALFP